MFYSVQQKEEHKAGYIDCVSYFSFFSFFHFKINTNKTGLISLESSSKARRFSRRWFHPFIKSICVTAPGIDPNNLKWLALGNHRDRTQPNSEMEQRVKSYCILN